MLTTQWLKLGKLKMMKKEQSKKILRELGATAYEKCTDVTETMGELDQKWQEFLKDTDAVVKAYEENKNIIERLAALSYDEFDASNFWAQGLFAGQIEHVFMGDDSQ